MLAENNDKDPILRHGGVMGLTSMRHPGANRREERRSFRRGARRCGASRCAGRKARRSRGSSRMPMRASSSKRPARSTMCRSKQRMPALANRREKGPSRTRTSSRARSMRTIASAKRRMPGRSPPSPPNQRAGERPQGRPRRARRWATPRRRTACSILASPPRPRPRRRLAAVTPSSGAAQGRSGAIQEDVAKLAAKLSHQDRRRAARSARVE